MGSWALSTCRSLGSSASFYSTSVPCYMISTCYREGPWGVWLGSTGGCKSNKIVLGGKSLCSAMQGREGCLCETDHRKRTLCMDWRVSTCVRLDVWLLPFTLIAERVFHLKYSSSDQIPHSLKMLSLTFSISTLSQGAFLGCIHTVLHCPCSQLFCWN